MSGAAVTEARRGPDTEVVERIGNVRIVPVATIANPDDAEPLAAALAAGGLPCVEIAFRSAAAAEAVRRARSVDGMLVGAGTILSPELAEAAFAAGAEFAVAPGTNRRVVERCRELGLPFFPGVATPSEIEAARELGLRVLKVFPANAVGGPAFLRAVAAVYPDVRFVPTGGIGPDTAGEYLALPSVLAVGGSWLVRESLLDERRFDEVERLARDAVERARR